MCQFSPLGLDAPADAELFNVLNQVSPAGRPRETRSIMVGL